MTEQGYYKSQKEVKKLESQLTELKSQIEAVKEQIALMPQVGSGYDYWVNALRKALQRGG